MKLLLRDLQTIAGYALREAVRRKVLLVVVVLTVCFLALYAFGTYQAFQEVSGADGGGFPGGQLEEEVLTGSTLLGLAMFVTLFLGTVLAVFVTLNAVRGDAERGLLQPLVVRPVGRTHAAARALPGGGRGVRDLRADRLLVGGRADRRRRAATTPATPWPGRSRSRPR